jgi:putative DNA methylase
MTAYRKKLIEVALPLDAINRESAREKAIRHGHPSTLHLWWARRPLAACRAVIFASLVDDPDEPNAPKAYLEALDKLEKPPSDADGRRERLFWFIERLVNWDSTTDEELLEQARDLIRLSCEGSPPPVLDPFCGGGSIPLEAQRLGLEAYASDLNPVAVLITKAMVEIPPKSAGRPPVNPDDRAKMGSGAVWKGAAGLAADVRYYGKWMRDRAWERIGHLYPKGPHGEMAIAWLWARTVKCPNPACGAQIPLVRSFWLSRMRGKEAWVEPIVDRATKTVRFEMRTGNGAAQGTVSRTGARCIACGAPVDFEYARREGAAGRMDAQLMAIVAEGSRGRLYLSPDPDHQRTARQAQPAWAPDTDLPKQALGFRVQRYGMTKHADLFTARQLVALTTFSDLVGEARALALEHARQAGLPDDGVGIAEGGSGATAYADAVATYLAFTLSKLADKSSTISTWDIGPTSNRTASGRSARVATVRVTFARQALPMTWDFAEVNPFSEAVGSIETVSNTLAATLDYLPANQREGSVRQLDATVATGGVPCCMVFTDPPYYDNIGYADLSDFFYVWLRRSLARLYPDLFATVLTPKAQELVATPYRFDGDKRKAEQHFEEGFRRAFALIRQQASPDYPITLYYAFKQAENDSNGDGTSAVASTGWQTMLQGLLTSGFQVIGTWPIRTEMRTRNVARATNALASSIVVVCRPRPESAPTVTFKQFQSELGRDLPPALAVMTGRDREEGSQPWVDPIDLRQAAIGPGMAVYSRCRRVQKADGTALSVREALQEVNEAIDRYFDEMEGELDPTSRFCLHWYKESGFVSGAFGRAEVLAKATNVDPELLERRGLLDSTAGKVRLFKPAEYRPEMGEGVSIWELAHRLVAALESGEEPAARLYNRAPGLAEEARDLAYRLYLEAEKKGRAEDALGYNALVASWTDIRKKATELREESQGTMI